MKIRDLEQPHKDIGKRTLSFLRFFNFRKNISANKNMFDELKKINIKTCSDKDLIIWFRRAFPAIQEFYQRFCKPKSLSCDECFKLEECKQYNKKRSDKTCLRLEQFLPRRYEGTGYREKNSGLMINELEEGKEYESEYIEYESRHHSIKSGQKYLTSIHRIKSNEEFSLYKNCPINIFTKEQWEAICLRYDKGHKQKEIAKSIGISRSSVSDRLRRAKKKMKNYYEEKKLKKI